MKAALRRLGGQRTVAWLSSCLASWTLFFPFFGPVASLLSLWIPLAVYFPGPSLGILWKAARTGEATFSWAWRRTLRPEALAVPLAIFLAGTWLLTVTPHEIALQRFEMPVVWFDVVAIPLTVGGTAWWASLEVTVRGIPVGYEDVGGGRLRAERTRRLPLAVQALGAALAAGGSAWLLRSIGRTLMSGTREIRVGMEEVAGTVRWLDEQFSAGLFGPTYVYQDYWVLLIAGAGLLATITSVLLRDFSARVSSDWDPFAVTTPEQQTDKPLPEASGKVFLSYSRRDSEFARRIRESLAGKLRNVWVDWESIEPSDQWRQAIDDGIRTSDAFIVLVSGHSLRSPYCRDECMKAISLRKRILPIVIDPEVTTGLTALMREHDWQPLREYQSRTLAQSSGEGFDQGIADIVSFVTQRYLWDAFHTRLGNLSHDWWQSGCKAGLLLRAEELELAESWQRKPWYGKEGVSLTEAEQRYLTESRRAARRRTRSRRSFLALVTAVVVTLSLLAVTTQADSEKQRRSALSRKLAATSLSLTQNQPEKAVQTALAAYAQAPTAEARSALASHLTKLDKVRTIIAPEKEEVSHLLLSPDGKLLFIERKSSTTTVWDVAASRSRGTVRGSLLSWYDSGARSLTADGRLLALRTGERQDSIELVNTRTLQVEDKIRLSDIRVDDSVDVGRGLISTGGGGITPDGKYLISGGGVGAAGVIFVWHVREHRLLKVLDCDSAEVAPSGKSFVCARDNKVRIFSLPGPLIEQTIDTPSWSFTGYTADDGVVVNFGETADMPGQFRIYGLGSRQPWIPTRNLSVESLHAGGRYAALETVDAKGWELWDLQKRRRILKAETHDELKKAKILQRDTPLGPHSVDEIEATTSDGHTVATLARDGSVVIWGSTAYGRIREHHSVPAAKEQSWFAVNPTKRLAAAADKRLPVVHVWDSRNGVTKGTLRLADLGNTMAFSQDGSLLAVAERSKGKNSPIEVFRVPGGRRVALMHYTPGMKSGLPSLHFSPDNRYLYGALQGESRVAEWELSTGSEIHSYEADPVRDGYGDQAALSADGSTLALTGRQLTVSLWETATGRDVPFEVSDVTFATLSPNGNLLATVGREGGGSVTLWDTHTHKQIGSRLVPDGGVSRMQFSPDGNTLAVVTYGGEGTSRELLSLWDVKGHQQIGPVLLSMEGDAAFSFSPDSGRIEVADSSGSTKLQVAESTWVSELCNMVTRSLGNNEWQSIAPGEQYRTPC